MSTWKVTSILLVIALLFAVGGLVWFIHWHIKDVVIADVCLLVIDIYPNNTLHLGVVRGYNEEWDQFIGIHLVEPLGSDEVQEGDRLTARSLYNEWRIDWDHIYDECPEATVR